MKSIESDKIVAYLGVEGQVKMMENLFVMRN